MQYDLTAIGELLIDFVPNGCADNGVQQFGANPGGAPANVCAISAKLGDHVAFIGKVGTELPTWIMTTIW